MEDYQRDRMTINWLQDHCYKAWLFRDKSAIGDDMAWCGKNLTGDWVCKVTTPEGGQYAFYFELRIDGERFIDHFDDAVYGVRPRWLDGPAYDRG